LVALLYQKDFHLLSSYTSINYHQTHLQKCSGIKGVKFIACFKPDKVRLDCQRLLKIKIAVVYNGINLEMFKPSKNLFQIDKWNIPKDSKNYLVHGRLDKRKDWNIIKAFGILKIILALGCCWKTSIARGEYQNSLEQLSKEFGYTRMREIPRSRDQYYLRLPNQWGICSAQCVVGTIWKNNYWINGMRYSGSS